MKKRLIPSVIFCYIMMATAAFVRPLIIENIMDEGLIKQELPTILHLAVLLLFVAIIEEVICIFQVKLFEDLKKKFVLNIYLKAFKKLLNIKTEYFQKNNSSEIINKLSTDINTMGIIVDSSMMSIMNYFLQIISGVIGLFVISWKLALLVLLLIPLKCISVSYFSYKKEAIIKEVINESTEFSAWLSDNIQGIKEIKLWNLYKRKHTELEKRKSRVLDLEKRNSLLAAYNSFCDSGLQWFIVSGLYAIGGYWICNGSLSLGELTAFITYSNYVMGPISLLFNLKLIFAQLKPSISRLHEFYNLETEEKGTDPIFGFKDKIQFNNVTFSYNHQPLLKDICLSIRKGEKIAIVGDNGTGKSTLINLLLRFWKPNHGEILIDGKVIDAYNLNAYRELFSVVSQEIYLFQDSVRNNITMGRKENELTFEYLCTEMRIDEIVQKLLHGYESILDNYGENLSGGERQKIALLRALFKNAPILILDEATANIDNVYNELVHHHVLKESDNKTVIMITHRLDNLEGMDKIYKINNGRLIECEYHDIIKNI